MVVRAPIIAQLIWIAFDLSPFLLLIPVILYEPHWVVVVIVSLISFVCSKFIQLSLTRHTRQRVIQTIYRKKAKQQQKPFILISRSYKQVNELAYHGSVHGIGAFAISLFKTLIYDISHRHPIIVLGDKDLDPDESAGRALYMSAWPDKTEDVGMMTFNEQTGITTIGHEVTWEEIFVNLAKASKFVLVIPATSEGFLTELNLLKSKGLGCKVVVYMWPEHNKHPYKPLCAHPEKWEEIRHTLREHGFNFPAHKKSGALIRLNEDFEVAHIYEPIPRKNILDLLNDVNFGEEHPMSSMVPFIENYEITANADRYGPMWGYTSS